MKWFIVIALLCGFVARAEDNPAADVNSGATGKSHNMNIQGKKTVGQFGKPDKKQPTTIQGTCEVMVGGKNPFEGPCVQVPLLLRDVDSGQELMQARTDANGDFGFGLDSRGNYKVESASRFYDVMKPKEVLHGGETITVKLWQK